MRPDELWRILNPRFVVKYVCNRMDSGVDGFAPKASKWGNNCCNAIITNFPGSVLEFIIKEGGDPNDEQPTSSDCIDPTDPKA